jgi:hypothetical protein
VCVDELAGTQNRDRANVGQGQKVSVTAHDGLGCCGDGTLEELVILGVTADRGGELPRLDELRVPDDQLKDGRDIHSLELLTEFLSDPSVLLEDLRRQTRLMRPLRQASRMRYGRPPKKTAEMKTFVSRTIFTADPGRARRPPARRTSSSRPTGPAASLADQGIEVRHVGGVDPLQDHDVIIADNDESGARRELQALPDLLRDDDLTLGGHPCGGR